MGAWLSAVFIVPVVKRLDARHGMMTYPEFLRLRYGDRVALVAALISALGYLGFTSGQILAGDTVQWTILMIGLLGLAIPFTLYRVGGVSALIEALPPGHTSLVNVDALTLVNWFITIAPIWVVAMTLYQRMYASPTVRDARQAWFIAGLFEYPVDGVFGSGVGGDQRTLVRVSQAATLLVGAGALLIASRFTMVLDAIL